MTKKAGIDIDDSELYIVKSTPSQILQLKNHDNANQLKKYDMDIINNINDTHTNNKSNHNEENDNKSKKFEFGNLSTDTVNSLVPGAMDKEYKLKDGIKVFSTRQNLSSASRKRKKNVIVLMDKTEPKPEKIEESSSESEEQQDINDYYEPARKKRKTLGGLKAKSTQQLQDFLEIDDSDDDTLIINSMERQRKFTVKVNRLRHIIESRMKLPIIGEEYKIMECIKDNDVVLICGETGSGKSTQVPQFLYEAGYSWMESQNELESNRGHGGYGLIGVTEPRRVAAMSVSKRVGIELNNRKHVSYQIRYDSKSITKDTHIKFMTDGILLREIQYDFLLNKYSVIILDEAHERNLNTDVLIGLLSRIVRQRRLIFEKYLKEKNNGNQNNNQKRMLSPLKLIIMSATLKVEDFSDNLNLFDPSPPLIKIPARQYPVTVHFNKTTPMTDDEYEEEIFKKICKIHVLLPKGHILVFLTGRRQIEYMCTRLRDRFNKPTAKSLPNYDDKKNKKEQHYEKTARRKKDNENEQKQENDNDNDHDNDEEKVTCAEDLIMKEDKEDDDEDDDIKDDNQWLKLLTNWKYKSYAPVNILPLYSVLEPNKQSLVFNKQDTNTRLIVIATNIAETSITIPGIRYVVDCGRVKQEKYSAKENISKMVIEFISKSSAEQRAGRAGRTGPGHCYRLYSSNFYDKWMIDHFEPEILRVPIENIILKMKAMNIKSISSFPFPTPPKQDTILSGLRILETLGALRYNCPFENDVANKTLMILRDNKYLISDENKLEITKLGQSLIEYPISVRCAKMLILGYQGNCLPFIIAIVSLLSVESLQFMPDEIDKILKNRLELQTSSSSKNKQSMKEKDKQKWLRKEKRKMVIKARNQFTNNKSDILSFLNIFGAYKCYKNQFQQNKFCKEHFIRSKNISECNSLMLQLQKIIYKIYSDNDNNNNNNNGYDLNFKIKLEPKPPSNIQQILLRQIIASGLIDQIARKWPDGQIPNDNDWIKSKRNYLLLKKAYQSISIPNKPVYIHPSSYIYASNSNSLDNYTNDMPHQPQFVVYYSLHKSETVSTENDKQKHEKKTYMRYVTVIEPYWLLKIAPHLCIISDMLDTPKPFYDEKNDCIKGYVEVRFGPFQWELPQQTIIIKNDKQRYQWFARLLLQGEIFKDLKSITPYLQHRPSIITDNKYSIVSNKAVIGLISKLEEHKIDTKHKLKLSLTKNPKFLFNELKLWMYNIKHYVLKKVWPPNK